MTLARLQMRENLVSHQKAALIAQVSLEAATMTRRAQSFVLLIVGRRMIAVIAVILVDLAVSSQV